MGFTLTDVLLFGGAKESDADNAAFVIMRRNILRWGAIGGYVNIVVKGVPPLVLPDAIAGGLQYVKAFGGTGYGSVLPDGYKQVEYLENSGTGYVDTGVVLNTIDLDVEIDFQMTDIAATSPCMTWGYMGQASSLPRWGFGVYEDGWIGAPNTTVTRGTKDTSRHTAIMRTYISSSDTALYAGTLDGDTLLTANNLGNQALFESNTLPVYLFARNNNGTAGNYGNCKIYNFRITKAGVLIHNFIPCQNPDSELGFYDIITNNFVAATGNLSTGANAVPSPSVPMNIVSNNGVLKYTPNLLDMAAENIVLGKYINNSGVATDSPANFYNSKYIPVGAGGTYTWSTSSSIGYFSVMEYDSSKTFLQRTLIGSSSTPAGTSGSITLRADTAFVLIGSNMDGTEATLDKVAAVDWQFEKGSSATEYAPYVEGGLYTDGTVETINILGKNLWNPDVNSYSQFDVTSSAIRYGHTYKNGTYTISRNSTSGSYIIYAKLVSGSSYGTALAVTTNTSRTLTASGPDETILVYSSSTSPTGTTSYEVQVEKGSTATEYQPYYEGGTATAEMLLKLVGAVDEQEILSGTVARNVKVIVLDGTESFTTSTAYGKACLIYSAANIWGADSSIVPLCTHFLGVPQTSSELPVYTCFFNASGHFYFRLEDNTVATFKAWLAAQYAAGTPVMILVGQLTPTTESVAGQTLQVQAGDNTLEITQASLTGLELEAQYDAAVSLTIQEVQDANLDNNVTVTIQ